MTPRHLIASRHVVALSAFALVLAACSGGGAATTSPSASAAPTTAPASQAAETPAPPAEQGVDDGTTITMWTRSVTAAQTEAMVAAYNATHENQVELTVVPFQEYLQKVGAAAGGNQLPDLLGGNVIDGPNYASLGLWQDITGRIDGLDFKDTLAPSHISAASLDGKVYAVPHVIDVSALYYNEILFTEAGLDPAEPPATLAELKTAADKIAALGPDYGGIYFPGNCAGCLVFTVWPSIWGSGGTVMNPDGTAATLDSTESVGVFSAYNEMFKSGAMMDSSRNEGGPTQNEAFATGKVGFALLGSKALGTIAESADLKMGVSPIPSLDGGVSTFVGGDMMGISASSTKAEAAWNFLAWSMSEEVQLELFAKSLFIPVRTDLAENEYAVNDPRLVTFNTLVGQGETPYSKNFFQCFNDPTGPWLSLIRDAVFGDDAAAAAAGGNPTVTSCLAE
jgi:multiple sugar transport system substrate-binding protein